MIKWKGGNDLIKALNILLISMLVVFFMAGSVLAIPTVDGVFDTTEWAGYYADGDGTLGPGVGGQPETGALVRF